MRERAATAANESARVASVHDLGLLDSAPEERFLRIVRLAEAYFGEHVAAINLIDADRQITIAGLGIEQPVVPRSHSICSTTVGDARPLVIEDLRNERWREHPAATDLGLRFYAGAPLHSPDGERVGALCVAGTEPREFSPAEVAVLRSLAELAEAELARTNDLSEGRELQRRLQPRPLPDLPGWDVAGLCLQAGAVGGDIYDWQLIGDQVQLLLADVMGKGLSAAIVAAGVRAIARGTSPYQGLPGTLRRLATDLRSDLSELNSFVTFFAARFDTATGALAYADAGHGLAFILGADGHGRRLHSESLPVGIDPDEQWAQTDDQLEPGESLVVVSDGFLDLYGKVEELMAVAGEVAASASSATEITERLARGSGQRADDDLTVVVVRRGAA